MKGHIAEATVIVGAPPERVWAALTEPDQVRQYLMGTELETDWKPGSKITWSGEWDGKPYVASGKQANVWTLIPTPTESHPAATSSRICR